MVENESEISSAGTKTCKGACAGSRRSLFLFWLLLLVVAGAVPAKDFLLFGIDAALHDNLHEVTPGKFYRSAQMSYERLAQVIQQHGIRTVIDLRAGGDKWAEGEHSEQATVKKLGADYVHIPVVGSRLPSRETILKLLDTYDTATLPILLHDSSGTHRAGTASALWVLAHEKGSVLQAGKQLSLRYGFVRWERDLKSYLQGHDTIDSLLWNYEAAVARQPELNFRAWVEREVPSYGGLSPVP